MADDDQFDPDDPEVGTSKLRKAYDAKVRELEELKASIPQKETEAEHRGQHAATRRYDALRVFGENRPGLVDAWVAKNPDGELTTDVAKDFAASFGVSLGEQPAPEPPSETVPEEVKEAAGSFQQVVSGVPGAGRAYTPEEIRLIGLKDEAEALRLIAEGAMQTD